MEVNSHLLISELLTLFSNKFTLQPYLIFAFLTIKDRNHISVEPCFNIFRNIRPQPYLSLTLFYHFQQYKTPAVCHFSILNRLKSQSYLVFAFWTINNHGHILAVPYVSILTRLKSMSYLCFCFFNNERPQLHFIRDLF